MNCQECELALGCEEMGGAVEEHLRGCGSCRQLVEELTANGDAFESMGREQMPGVRVRRPVWPAAIAVAAAVVLLIMAIPREERLPPVHCALAPMKFEIPAMRRLDRTSLGEKRRPPLADGRGSVATIGGQVFMHTVAPKSAAAGQPLMVKMLTDDPNVVIYWQIDAEQEGNNK